METEEKYLHICNLIEKTYPILAPTWALALQRFGNQWLNEFVTNMERVFGDIGDVANKDSLINAIDGYAEFCNDSLRNQVYFEKFGKYRSNNYADCVSSFYENEDHMMRCYLPGMWISHYIWPQHYNMLSGFCNGTLRRIGHPKLFFEVGVGCGMYSKIVLEKMTNLRGIGFDISQFALNFTRKMIKQFGYGDRYNVVRQDIKLGYEEQCDFLICQEVLEHLENPAEFCKWLNILIKPGGFAYITAALNAGHSDHIYLITHPMELERILREAGFQPMGLQEEFAAGRKPREITPSLAGYLCEKV